jgi:hypothetical protein
MLAGNANARPAGALLAAALAAGAHKLLCRQPARARRAGPKAARSGALWLEM